MSTSTAPKLVINAQGESVVHSAGFRMLLAAKDKAKALGDLPALEPLSDELLRETLEEDPVEPESRIDAIVSEIEAAPEPRDTSFNDKRVCPAPEPSKRFGVKYSKVLTAAYNSSDPVVIAKYVAAAEKLLALDTELSRDKVAQAKNLEYMAALYHTFLGYHLPQIPVSRYWHEDTIRRYAELFLFNLVQCTRGRNGGPIRSSTLQGWVSLLVRLIGRHAYIDDYKSIGSKMLASGFFVTLRAREKWIVEKLKLNKYAPPRGYLDERDLVSLFEVGFASTEEYGRESFIQTQLAVNIVFFTGLRSGSLAAGNPKFKEWGLFIKLRDVTISVTAPGEWDVKLAAYHRKGYNELTDPGYALEFHLEHVKKMHNLIFDVGLFLVTHLYLRGAFVGIENQHDLFTFSGRQLKVKPEMLDEPLMLARSSGGYNLVKEPATAKNITDSLQGLAEQAGIPYAYFQAIRRSTANQWGIVYGAEQGRRLMGHAEGNTIFDSHYSRGCFNFELVPTRLGELDHVANAAGQMALMRQRNECMIVDAMINQRHDDEDDGEKSGGVGQSLTPEQKKKIKEDPFICMFDEKMSDAWDKVHAILPPIVAVLYERHNNAIRWIQTKFESDPKYIDNKDELEGLFSTLRSLGKLRTSHSRALAKKLRFKKSSVRQKEFDDKKADHTLAQLAEAEAALPALSTAIEPREMPDDVLEAYSDRFYDITSMGDNIWNPKFGHEILTDQILAEIRRPDLRQFLTDYAKKHLADPDETGFRLADPTEAEPRDEPEATDTALSQEGGLPIFDDKDQLDVFKVDVIAAKEYMMARLTAPVHRYRAMRKKAEANGGKYVCDACGDTKDVPTVFDKLGNYTRHLKTVHNPYNELRTLMTTSSQDIFKCPSDLCDFTASSIDKVYEHCVSFDCPEHRLFSQIKRACTTHVKSDENRDLRERKRARALIQGVEISKDTLDMLKFWEETSDQEIIEIALEAGVEDPNVAFQIPLMREMGKVVGSMAQNGKIVDENALSSLVNVCLEFLGDEEAGWIEEQVKAIEDEEALKCMDNFGDLAGALSGMMESSGSESD
ncbi:hypothetical protein RSOLAG1IB_00101 [Rhizoctonia solani AG-1 IB]|uniref:Uncharacterized protein n=1 Tax=Thanatephorus cucumeris (strain AG1-IB / isolate 7/3/14) TaxID=1108050 RepID=A0A0B7F0N5_THACB|nr:hypothetical protein RSOLAG1IB_00101 [Rhizoctonia solani AG-1 IB]